jgi:hypothetical protein
MSSRFWIAERPIIAAQGGLYRFGQVSEGIPR